MKGPLNIAGIVPARYASSRFPGKPLALIGDKPMIRLVYDQAAKALDQVYVATDDERIFQAVRNFGGKVIMTSPEHRSGTDRCAEAAEKLRLQGLNIDVIVNIQGDEPFIRPEQINILSECFNDDELGIATLVRKVRQDEDISDPNQPKVVLDREGYALYFSRAAIPYIRDYEIKEWPSKNIYFKHIGLYAYRSEILDQITKLPYGMLEMAESLEQNRWLENGFRIKTALTSWESIAIDTPHDLEKARLIRNTD
jgi:3-deoxy-manno-octulosonate cytidylyltransferase (CMP-KDO synthetase)